MMIIVFVSIFFFIIHHPLKITDFLSSLPKMKSSIYHISLQDHEQLTYKKLFKDCDSYGQR